MDEITIGDAWQLALNQLPKGFALNLSYSPDRKHPYAALAEANDAAPDGIYPIFYAEADTAVAALVALGVNFHTHEDLEVTH